MCGIAGYFGKNEIDVARIRVCLERMGRRGPDSASSRQWINKAGNHVHLLHSRLSIIDLDERSNQPFNVGSKWIAMNGELYNYLEVKSGLKAEGAAFRTESDTEVLLTAIDRSGWSVLDRCEGMWAFAIYDEGDGSLTLCRDRFGEKPLYIYRDGTGVYFGSEVKFITAMLGRGLEINIQHLKRYMVNGYKALYKGEERFYKGLAELSPASLMYVSANGDASTKVYWRPVYSPDDNMTFDEAVTEVRRRLVSSMKLRLRADVPIAFCMSGGIDSNALIGIAKREFNYDVHGFTIMNTDSRYEEQDMIDHSVSELGIRHTPITLSTEEFIPKLKTLVRYHDSPVSTITYFAHWLLMGHIAMHGYRISVSGTAADELFTGYYDHHLAYLYEIRDDHERYAAARSAWKEHVQPIVRNPYLSNADLFVQDRGFRGHIYLDADDFAKYMAEPWHEPFAEKYMTHDLLRNRMLNEMFHESVPVILHEDDLNAMYYSIENRSPFLDRGLFEFCYKIPSRYLIRDGFSKVVLREAMRGIVPGLLLDNRRKVGFNAPVYAFLDVSNPLVREYLLGRSAVYEHVRREEVEKLIRKPDLPNSESKFLFYFLNAKMFLEECAS